MGLGSFLFGARPQFGQLPGYSDLIGGIKDYNPGLGYAGKMAKKSLKRLYSGDDVSSMGEFNSLRQKQAADESGVDMDYLSGGNALLNQSGGDQSNQLNRMRDLAKEKIKQNSGMAMVDALSNFQNNANQTYGNAYQNQQGNQQAKFGMWGNALQNSLYDKSRKGGFLSQLPGMLAGAGSMMTGIGAI